MEKISKNAPLIVAILLPVVFLIILSIVVFLPRETVSPRTNFVYTSLDNFKNGSYYEVVLKNTYEVKDGKLLIVPVMARNSEIYPANQIEKETPNLFLYNVVDDTTKSLEFTEAQTLLLDTNPVSPDGFSLTRRYGGGDIFSSLFGNYEDQSGYFLTNRQGQNKKLTQVSGYEFQYGGEINFLGWVK